MRALPSESDYRFRSAIFVAKFTPRGISVARKVLAKVNARERRENYFKQNNSECFTPKQRRRFFKKWGRSWNKKWEQMTKVN